MRTNGKATTVATMQHMLAASIIVRYMTASPKKKANRIAVKQGFAAPPKHGKVFKKFSVALVGRPNVGKSSLFNRLVGRRMAIVNPIPGTTRDWKEADGLLGELRFVVMDTGGLEDRRGRDSIEAKMLQHTEQAIRFADVVLFVVDARQGITEEDERFARWVKSRRPQGGVHLIANKTEGWLGTAGGEDKWTEVIDSCYSLGLGEPIPVSAEHGEGLLGVYQAIEPYGLASTAGSATSASEAASSSTDNSHDVKANDGTQWSMLDGELSDGGDVEPEDIKRMTGRGAAASGFQTPLSATAPTASTAMMPAHAASVQQDAVPDNVKSFSSDQDALQNPQILPLDPKARKRVLARIERGEGTIQLAIVGRPNVGKSTLVNQLMGEERMLAGPTPGLTRDSVKVEIEAGNGRKVQIVDTAGMRRWGAWDLTTPLEGLAVGAARKALATANVVVLVVDGSGGNELGLTTERPTIASRSIRTSDGGVVGGENAPTLAIRGESPARSGLTARASRKVGAKSGVFGLTTQDMAIAQQILDEGRGLVIVINKMDASPNAEGVEEVIRRQMELTTHGKGVELVPISALRGLGFEGLLPAVLRTYDRWNRRVTTGRLNTWLQLVMRHHPPPTIPRAVGTTGRGRSRETKTVPMQVKVKYVTQVTSRPPTFGIFANRKDVPESYLRFLTNSLREEFDLKGIPIRMLVRAPLNPFTKAGRVNTTGMSKAGRTSAGLRRPQASRTSTSAGSRTSSSSTSPSTSPSAPSPRARQAPTVKTGPVQSRAAAAKATHAWKQQGTGQARAAGREPNNVDRLVTAAALAGGRMRKFSRKENRELRQAGMS